MKKTINIKSALPHLAAVAAFLLFSFLYCLPVFQGKVLQAGDVNNYLGASHETWEYYEQEGRQIWWTGSMFSGMPTFQVAGSGPSGQFRNKLEQISHFGMYGDKNPAGIVFGYLLGFYLMLLCFGVTPYLSLAGAFALALSSYFMLIIPAGHITKAVGLGCLAPLFGGCYAILKKRWRLGIPLVLIYGIIGLTLHPQMTYYVAMLIGVMVAGEIISAIIGKRYKDISIAIGVLALAFLFVFATKLSWWEMNNGYLKETMRGGHSELVTQDQTQQAKPAGLDYDYATAWSYGKMETLTLLIPYYMGGASGFDLGKDSDLEKGLTKLGLPRSQARDFCSAAPTYWGEKPFTSGPVYAGAIICFLFILGLLIVPGTLKWVLLAATLFSITLAWGHNLDFWSRLFFEHFPMYSKFRAVESILVVAEITIPLLGLLAVRQLIISDDAKAYRKKILISGGVTGLICLVVAIFGGSADVTSSYDSQWSGQVGDRIYDIILDQRRTLMTSSAWRSLLFVVIGALILYFYTFKKSGKHSTLVLSSLLGVAILCDMVPVDRHFFGKDNFVNKRVSDSAFTMTSWEETILNDDSLNYRVLNLSTNTFNDSRTSYRLKSIGGYHAAKLRRYQDLIDAHISKGNPNVIDMLNTKYIIRQDGSVSQNPSAMGNAWFVDEVKFVDTPNEESDALYGLDLHITAVADRKFSASLEGGSNNPDPEAYITLDKYIPDCLTYTSSCAEPKLAVFSEIYYPEGWHLYVDGKERPLGRVNYTLRAAVIPSGVHTLVMEFVPKAMKVDRLCIVLMILALVVSAVAIAKPWLPSVTGKTSGGSERQ